MRNIRLTLAYDGTSYVGWQIQPNGLSVQAAVEAALREFSGCDASLIAAGRTDAGVHALGQVANFRTESAIPCQGFRAGLQAYLPDDIVVRHAEEVDPAFHATYSAKRKCYRYVIDNARPAHPFLRHYAHEFHAALDTAAMHAAAQALLGTHDFCAFESQHPNTASSVRTLFEATVGRFDGWPAWNAPPVVRSSRPGSGELEPGELGRGELGRGELGRGELRRGELGSGEFIWIDIVADGFLYNMVRAIAGTLIRVGERKWDAGDVRRILDGHDRAQAGPTAPACGLYLVSVDYDDAPRPPAAELSSVASIEARP